jgi:iron complex transport system substrate-binding protein
VSGGNSFQARFYKDAAAEYIWSDFKQNGSVPLDIEVVLKEGAHADFWMNPGDKQSIDEILSAYPSFSSFKSIKEGRVYSNYGLSNRFGANEVWERGVVRPDLILMDLARIFHPEIMQDRDLYFYKRLE